MVTSYCRFRVDTVELLYCGHFGDIVKCIGRGRHFGGRVIITCIKVATVMRLKYVME